MNFLYLIRVILIFRLLVCLFFFFQAEDGIRDLVRSRGLGDVYKRQAEFDPRGCRAPADPTPVDEEQGQGEEAGRPELPLSLIHI